jgi:hypothetical protein
MPRKPAGRLALVAWGLLGCGELDVGSDQPVPASDAHAVDEGGPLAVQVAATPDRVCRGGCAWLAASATGGVPPYTYAWTEGLAPSAVARVCPATTTTYVVTATDGSGKKGELPTGGAVASTGVTVSVADCADASAVACDGGTPVVTAGWYAGTFYCPPEGDGGIVSLPGPDGGLVTGNLWVDLATDPATGLPHGTLYGQWVVLGVITFQANLEASVDCNGGEFVSPWVNGVWGIPSLSPPPDGGPPVTVMPAGAVTGDFVIGQVSAAAIAGRIDWGPTVADAGSGCHGTWGATRQP